MVLGIAYYLSAYYLAQDQTLYSRMMRSIVQTFNSFPLTKTLHRESSFLHDLRTTVDLDTYFRVKREITLRLGPKIIFAAVTLLGASIYLINLYTPLASSWSDLGPLVHTLIFALHLKLLYLTLNLGLYAFPLKLGAYLSVPKSILTDGDNELPAEVIEIELRAKKVLLNTNTAKKSDITISLHRGQSVLLVIPNEHERVAHLLAGFASGFGTKKWIVRLNGKYRLLYQQWADANIDRYYVHLQNYPETSVVEYLGGTINLEDPTYLEFLATYPEFHFLFRRKNFLSERIHQGNFKPQEYILLQIAYCLIHRPKLIVIDPLVVDLPYPEIKSGLGLLSQSLKESIVVGVSHQSIDGHPAFNQVSTF